MTKLLCINNIGGDVEDPVLSRLFFIQNKKFSFFRVLLYFKQDFNDDLFHLFDCDR